MTKRFGFTLAEVLITLGIIGVVAAMTMPTLINQTRGAQYKTAFKKALSAFSQAVTLNVALDDWDFSDAVKGTAGTTGADNTVLKLLQDRMNVVSADTVSNVASYITSATGCTANKTCDSAVGTGWQVVTLSDGISLFYDASKVGSAAAQGETAAQAACTEDNKCYGVIDVNGQKGPNKYVTCDTDSANVMDELTTEEATEVNASGTCEVDNPTDIYPVFFYNQTVVPASAAAKAVLYGK